MLLIGPFGTNFNEILREILTISFNKIRLNVSFAKWRPFCPGPNVLNFFHPGSNGELPLLVEVMTMHLTYDKSPSNPICLK